MYVTGSRFARRLPSSYHIHEYRDGRAPVEQVLRPFSKTQTTYSWRTGKELKKQLDALKRGSNYPVRPRRSNEGDGLLDQLANRKRIIEDQMQNATDSLNNADFRTSDGISITSDAGHNFWTSSTVISPSVCESYWSNATYRRWYSRGYVQPGYEVRPSGPWGVAPSFAFAGLPYPLPPTTLQQTDINQGLFNSARPDASAAGIGETLYELFTGQWPRLLTNLGKRIATGKLYNLGVKDVGKYAGDAYLNSTFAWQPIIRDFEFLIRTCLGLTDVLYGGDFRRTRQTPPVTYPISWKASRAGLFPGFGVSSTYFQEKPAGSLLSEGTYSYDTRLNAKFSKAKPTIGTYSFIDSAQDVLRTLGIWSPSLGWDILPYSWLVDWFFHIGRAFENASTYSTGNGTYHVNYAYATQKTTSVIWWQGGQKYSGSDYVKWQAGSQVVTTLFRQRATPWGFGIDLSKLSQSQWQILIALGLAKAR